MTETERNEMIERILGGYSQEELAAAFKAVQDRMHWKRPIDARMPAGVSEALMRTAIIHFTGSVPMFYAGKNGTARVKAAGYYAAIGA